MAAATEYPSDPHDLIEDAARYFGPPEPGNEDEMWRDARDFLQAEKERLESAPVSGLDRYRFAVRENKMKTAAGAGAGMAGKTFIGLGFLDLTSASSEPEYVMAGAGFLAGLVGIGMGYERMQEVRSFANNIPDEAESYGRAIETIEAELAD